MLVKRKRGWELRESEATPEAVFHDRRRVVQAMGFGALIAAAGGGDLAIGEAMAAVEADPSAGLYPAKQNPRYTLDRPITDEKLATTYNNFYEFGSQKTIAEDAQALPIRPWTVTIDGMVAKPLTLGIDELLKRVTLEERLYRHRCVEAWSMAVPWSGFPLKALIDLVEPQGSAKFLRMETFRNAKVASGQKQFWYPWPYVEGLTMAEATNELAFLVTGMYGKPVPRQDGAPLRLALPWEYGFWANVNPEVPHPRWSQATERVLGSDERRPTLKWNGYGEYVAHLYDGLTSERLFT